jgi:hypothetical protein
MLIRVCLAWCGLLLVAVMNGAAREAWIIPLAGDAAGHAISTITLCVAILAFAWLTAGWLRPASAGEALRIGVAWLTLTLAFEFLAGHYLFGTSWEDLLADYNVFRGRIWMLVLVTTALAPLAGRRRFGS